MNSVTFFGRTLRSLFDLSRQSRWMHLGPCAEVSLPPRFGQALDCRTSTKRSAVSARRASTRLDARSSWSSARLLAICFAIAIEHLAELPSISSPRSGLLHATDRGGHHTSTRHLPTDVAELAPAIALEIPAPSPWAAALENIGRHILVHEARCPIRSAHASLGLHGPEQERDRVGFVVVLRMEATRACERRSAPRPCRRCPCQWQSA